MDYAVLSGWVCSVFANLAMGGQNGGNIDDSHMPMQYFIDYVRIYQKERHITAINNTQDDNNDQLIHFGKNSCNVNIKAFTGKVTATVFNLTGQILSQSIGQAENMSLPLNLKSLNSGIYILQVTDGKIIKTQKKQFNKQFYNILHNTTYSVVLCNNFLV